MTVLVLGDLRFELRLSSARRALEITVERDGGLILSAPPGVADATLQEFACRKRMWVYKQLARRDLVTRAVRRKEYVDGEGLSYLGRSYRLRLVEESDRLVALRGGRFLMLKSAAEQGRQHMIRWYTDRGYPWLSEKVAEYAARMEVLPAGVRVQDLGYRWGSCGKGDLLYFHWKTMLLPPALAEYVVVHEMAHLREPHHTPEFWRRVERVMPGFEAHKARLAARGHEVEGV